jgi:hypothetical protein
MPGGTRWLALALIVAVHLLALLLWPQRAPERAVGKGRETAITFVLAPKPVQMATPPANVRGKSQPRVRVPVSAPVENAIRQLPTVPDPDPIAEPEPAVVSKNVDEILGQARIDIGKIDREVRKASPDMAVRNVELHRPKLEMAIAGAFKERGPAKMEEVVLPDGRRMTRVGNMCAVKESNGLVGGRDVFKDGVKTRWQSCPR